MWDFWDLVNIEEFWEKRDYFDPERWDVSFYCKDCALIIETTRTTPQGYTFSCNTCWKTNIVIGTEKWLKDNYRIK